MRLYFSEYFISLFKNYIFMIKIGLSISIFIAVLNITMNDDLLAVLLNEKYYEKITNPNTIIDFCIITAVRLVLSLLIAFIAFTIMIK